jgi:hypothetical protein
MDQLTDRIERELAAADAIGQAISEFDLAQKLSLEFSSLYGQADVRAAVVAIMRRRARRQRANLSRTKGSGFSR